MTQTIDFEGISVDPLTKRHLTDIASRFAFPYPIEDGKLTLRITEIQQVGKRYRIQAEWGHRRSSVSYFRSGSDLIQTALGAMRHLSAGLTATAASIDINCAA